MNLTEFIKDYWQLAASLVTILYQGLRYSIKMTNWQVLNDRKITELQAAVASNVSKIELISPVLLTLQIDMASVRTSLKFIETSLTQMNQNEHNRK